MLFSADAGNGKSFVFYKHGHILLENSITFDSFWYVVMVEWNWKPSSI